MVMPKSRLKGDFFDKKATKKTTKFRRKQAKKKSTFSPIKQTIFTIPSDGAHLLNSTLKIEIWNGR